MTNDIHFINQWKAMVLSQYINETRVYDQGKEMFRKKKGTAPNFIREIFPLNKKTDTNCDIVLIYNPNC